MINIMTRKIGGNVIATLIRGDNATTAIRFNVPERTDGVDLSGLSWAALIRNAAGGTDVYVPAKAERDGHFITFDWFPGGVATAAAGLTEVMISGTAQADDPPVWQSATYYVRVDEKVDADPTGDDAVRLTELQRLIVFVSGELNGVIEAGRSAREAANRANEAAERAESIAGVAIDATLTQPGAAADAAAVGGKFDKLSEEISNKASEDTAPLGAELVTETGWTLGAGWNGNLSSGFSHSSGVETLIFAMPEETAGNFYQVSFKSSSPMTETNLFLSVGNSPLFNMYFEEHADGTISVGVLAAENGNLVFTPATDYKGTITEVSVKRITGKYPALKQYMDTDNNVSLELRVSPADQDNVFAGINAGQSNTTGNRNVALGANALRDNLSGWRNIAIGSNALAENTSGTRNTAIGENAMPKLQSGQRNIAIGTSTMERIVNGNRNIAIGADGMFDAEDCDDCVAIGFAALNNNSGDANFGIGTYALYKASGSSNVAIGHSAGHGITEGWDNVAIGARSVYNLKTGMNNVGIGAYALTGASNSDQCNYNVAIGYGAARNIGRYSGNNVVIGANAAASLSGADYCIVIGSGQDVDASANHQLNIGGLLTGSLATGAAYLTVNGGLVLPNIPTSDPGVAGQVWNDNGTLKISAG